MLKKSLYIYSERQRGQLLQQLSFGIWDMSIVESTETCDSIHRHLEEKSIEFVLLDSDIYEKFKNLFIELPCVVLNLSQTQLNFETQWIFYPCSFLELEQKVNDTIKSFYEVDACSSILGKSHATKEIKDFIQKACKYDFPVVISGETGTGKNLIAKLIHTLSSRKNKKFLEINVTTIPHSLCESIFFGVSKGAFTGALDKSGLFEVANGGTVFLDEIESMDMQTQGKLLSVIEQKKFMRLGEHKERSSDFRLITATNESLEEKVYQKTFRQDLYYRLNILPFYIKPLRERREDIPEIAANHVASYNKQLSSNAYEKLQNHSWYGNVRELKNCLTRAVAISNGDTIFDTDIVFPQFGN